MLVARDGQSAFQADEASPCVGIGEVELHRRFTLDLGKMGVEHLPVDPAYFEGIRKKSFRPVISLCRRNNQKDCWRHLEH